MLLFLLLPTGIDTTLQIRGSRESSSHASMNDPTATVPARAPPIRIDILRGVAGLLWRT